MRSFLRWLSFLTLGRVMDSLSILLHVVYLPYFVAKVRGAWGSKIKSKPWIETDKLILLGANDPVRDEIFASSGDSHNLMCQIGQGFFHFENAGRMAELAVTPEGSLYRKCPQKHGLPPSRDCLAAWCYFYEANQVQRPDILERVANHFIKNCFSLKSSDGTPSARGSVSFNVLHGDGWGGMSPPVTGPHYLAGAALLALAADRLGGKWRAIYWIYFAILGGWLWNLIPYIHTAKHRWFYEAHVAMMSLFVLSKNRGGLKFAMRWISRKCTPQQNHQPFFSAMASACGHLSDTERMDALDLLRSIDHTWPQYVPSSQSFVSGQRDSNKNHSMMAMAAVQLLRGGK